MRPGPALLVCSLLLTPLSAPAAEDPGQGIPETAAPAGESAAGSVGDDRDDSDIGPAAFETGRARSSDGRFWALALTLTAATIYDGETTFAALDRCETCREGNPLMRGLVEGGRGKFYAAQMAVNAAALYAAHRLRGSEDPAARARWWWPSVAIIGTHTIAGTLNLRF